jgi:hypothetical protein
MGSPSWVKARVQQILNDRYGPRLTLLQKKARYLAWIRKEVEAGRIERMPQPGEVLDGVPPMPNSPVPLTAAEENRKNHELEAPTIFLTEFQRPPSRDGSASPELYVLQNMRSEAMDEDKENIPPPLDLSPARNTRSPTNQPQPIMDGVNPPPPYPLSLRSSSPSYSAREEFEDEEDEELEDEEKGEGSPPHAPLAFGQDPRAKPPPQLFQYLAPRNPLPRPGPDALERSEYTRLGYNFSDTFLKGFVIGMARAWNPAVFDFLQRHNMAMEDMPRAVFNWPRTSGREHLDHDCDLPLTAYEKDD